MPNVKKIRDLNLNGNPWANSACCGRPLPFAIGWNISLSKKNWARCYHKCILVFIWSTRYSSEVPVIHLKYPLFIWITRYSSEVPVIHLKYPLFIWSTSYSSEVPVIHLNYPLFIWSTRYSFEVPVIHLKYPLFSSDFEETLILLTDFRKLIKYEIWWKFVQG